MKRFITSIFIALIITAIIAIFEIGELFILAAAIDTIGLGWTALATLVIVFILVAIIVMLIYRIFGHKHWHRHHRNHGRRY